LNAVAYRMDKKLLLQYLNYRRFPLADHQEEGSRLHNALCESAPTLYLDLLTDSVAHISHKREILLNVLLTDEFRQMDGRKRVLDLLNTLPVEQGLQIISVISDLRINRRSTRELMLTYLLGHESLPELAAVKRQRLSRLLSHVLGERTWSSVRRFLASSTLEGEQFLRREILRYAWKGDLARTREVLCFLAGVPFNATLPALVRSMSARQDISQGKGLPQETLSGLRGVFHQQVSIKLLRQLAAPAPTTVRADGPLTVAYKDALAKQTTTEEIEPESPLLGLLKSLRHRIDGMKKESEQNPGKAVLELTVKQLPELDRHVAIVLDLSGSMAASGERFNHPVALALALTRLLQACISDLHLFQSGGSVHLDEDTLPQPQGVADLAQTLLEAVRSQPQLILIITDGYENLRQGDTAWVMQGLRKLGYDLPIYQVVPLFTSAEKLELRRLCEEIPLVPIAHEEHVRELLARVLLVSESEQFAIGELQQLQQLLTKR
jgi:hypothetical protein